MKFKKIGGIEMLSGLEIIEIIKEYIDATNEKLEASKMFGINNRNLLKYQAQKEILEQLLNDVDLRIEQYDVFDKYTKGQWHR